MNEKLKNAIEAGRKIVEDAEAQRAREREERDREMVRLKEQRIAHYLDLFEHKSKLYNVIATAVGRKCTALEIHSHSGTASNATNTMFCWISAILPGFSCIVDEMIDALNRIEGLTAQLYRPKWDTDDRDMPAPTPYIVVKWNL